MKRSFLVLALVGAFGMALLGSAQKAMAACPVGVSGTQLSGNYAVKIQGAATDIGTCAGSSTCPDPTPQAIAAIGVLHFTGTCAIDGGDLIYADQKAAVITSPATFPELGPIPNFSGVAAPNGNDVGTYGFNSNNQGTISFTDTPSGKTFSFGVVAELGNSEFRGSRLNPGDPLIIVGEKQATGITAATYNAQGAVTFDAGGGGSAGGALGVGFDAVGVEVVQHFDPETNTTPEGGGTIFFNVDNGYDSTIFPGAQIIPPGGGTLVCDFHLAVLTQGTADGTQLSHASILPDFSCPLSGAAFDNASVLWGSTNTSQFVMTVGTNGVAAKSGAAGNVGRAIATGAGAGGIATLAETNANLHPLATITLSNKAAESIDYTSLTLNGVPDVTIARAENSQCTGAGTPAACCTGAGTGTCTTADCTAAATPFFGCTGAGAGTFSTCAPIGDIHANNVLFGPGSCTVVVQGTGAHQCTSNMNASCTGVGTPFTCCSGAGAGTCVTETGNLSVDGNDHTFIGATQTGTGAQFTVKCL